MSHPNRASGPHIEPVKRKHAAHSDPIRYEDLLRAIGAYIDTHGVHDVLVTQLPDGMLLKGTAIDHETRGAVERVVAVLFTQDDVVQMQQQGAARRGNTDQLRARSFDRRD